MAKAVKNILFDQTSANLDSPVFRVGEQVTVIAVGMAPGDSITFEVISLISGDPSSICGCRLNKATNATIGSVQPLLCPSCESDGQVQVTLTENNPVVVLDWPQGALLRAMYHGTGIDDRTVTVWYNETETRSLTDAMRGCVPACCMDEEETWTVTGIHRCTPDVVEVQEQSNCGNFRWVECGAVVWTDTGQLRCVAGSETATEIEQTNQCGQRRWTAGPAQVWTDTGEVRCTSANVEAQQVNQCGLTRWVDTGTAVAWIATGLTRCVEGSLLMQETTQCGQLRWTDTEEACGGEGSIVTEAGSCLTGDGTPATPLGIDMGCLAEEVLDTGFNVQDTPSVDLSGNGTLATPLSADVQLSPDTGNLLTERSNGLYYGLEAPPEVAVLYVSTSLGDNSNPGTRALPLQTIDEAFARQINAPVNYTILLRAGETFVQTGRPARNLANYVITYYDDPIYDDAAAAACAGYHPMYADNLSRPTWVIDARLSGDGTPINTGVSAGNLSLRGLRILGRWQLPDTTQPSIPLSGVSAATIECFGCVLNSEPQPRTRWMFVAGAIDLATTEVDFDLDGLTYITRVTGPVEVRLGSHLNPGGCGASTPPITDLVTSTAAALSMVTVNNLAAGASYHASTKSTWGVTPTWDLFASLPTCCDSGEGDIPGNAPPSANFTVAGTGLAIDFTDTSTDGDGTIASREWDFGDGNTSTLTNPSNVYAANGSYFVRLKVTDDDGAFDTRTVSITVNDGSSGGGGTPPSGPGYPPSTNPL